MTGEFLKKVLRYYAIPKSHDSPAITIFQQDGSSFHNAISVSQCLKQQLPNCSTGRAGLISRPARWPGFKPCDKCLWGYLKDFVYDQPPKNNPHLQP